jgi:hypothetical protein
MDESTAMLSLLECYSGFRSRGYEDADLFLAAATLLAVQAPAAHAFARLALLAFERERVFHGDEATWLELLAKTLG